MPASVCVCAPVTAAPCGLCNRRRRHRESKLQMEMKLEMEMELELRLRVLPSSPSLPMDDGQQLLQPKQTCSKCKQSPEREREREKGREREDHGRCRCCTCCHYLSCICPCKRMAWSPLLLPRLLPSSPPPSYHLAPHNSCVLVSYSPLAVNQKQQQQQHIGSENERLIMHHDEALMP